MNLEIERERERGKRIRYHKWKGDKLRMRETTFFRKYRRVKMLG